jgi:predicted O-methyltransferase YrrM
MIIFIKLINKIKSINNDCFYLLKNKLDLVFVIKFIYFSFLKTLINIKYKDKKNIFLKDLKKYKITQYWFVNNIPIWLYIFKKFNYSQKKLNILEIGSYEGLSSIFFLKTLTKSRITCVDIWSAPRDEQYYKKYNKFNIIEKNFDYNTKIFGKRLKKIKNYSKDFFKKNKKKYDIIYIDGGHTNDIIYSDLVNAFDTLEENGIIIADDLFWNQLPTGKNPINAIYKFININKNKIKIILIYSQLIIQKSFYK